MSRFLVASLAATLFLAGCGGGDGGSSAGNPPVIPPPSAADDTYGTAEDTALTIDAPGLLGNDVESAGKALKIVLLTTPNLGSLDLKADGSFVYSPSPDVHGEDEFTYQVSSDNGLSGVATVRILIDSVTDMPVAVDDLLEATEDTEFYYLVPGILTNDLDPDHQGFVIDSIVTTTQHGYLHTSLTGYVVYMPHPNFAGVDSFSYRIKSGTTLLNVATVTIVVAPVNDLPVAGADGYQTPFETVLVVGAPGVLGNDTDIDGDPLAAFVVSAPLHGSVALAAAGSFVYTPDAGYTGLDIFTYVADDGPGLSPVATVTINVGGGDPAPVYGMTDSSYGAVSLLQKYPAAGGGAPTTLWTPPGTVNWISGFTIDRAAEYAYVIIRNDDPYPDPSTQRLYKVDLADGSAVELANLDSFNLFTGLDTDSAGTLFTANYYNGKAYSIDPETGALTLLGPIGTPTYRVATGSDDELYVTPLYTEVGLAWIHRFEAGAAPSVWALAPAGANEDYYSEGNMFLVPAGVAMNGDGEAFAASMETNKIYRYVDVNGDGDALDDGEEVEFGSLPYGYYSETMISIQDLAAGLDGSLLVNMWGELDPVDPAVALFWLKDRDGDGDAQDELELLVYNEKETMGGDGGAIALKR